MWLYPLEFCLYPSKLQCICAVMHVIFSLHMFWYMKINLKISCTFNCTQKREWNRDRDNLLGGKEDDYGKKENACFSFKHIMHSTAKNNFFLLAVHFLFVCFQYNMKKMFYHHAICIGLDVLFLLSILSSMDSKKLKDNYSITSLSELFVCSDSGKSWTGTYIFRQERICIEESSCKRPDMGGPSSSALRWQSQQTVRQKYVGNQTLLIPRIYLIFWTLSINFR